jgi:hypothetical protein
MLSGYKDHISRKNACNKNLNKLYECDNCKKKFTSMKGKKNHIKLICNNNELSNIREELIKTKEKLKEYETMKEEIEILKTYIIKKPGRPKKVTNNTNCNNTTNIQNIYNTQYVSFGNEELDKLSNDQKKWICSKSYGSLKECTKLMNCNPQLPEQQNVYITNIKSDFGYVMKEGKLKVIDIDDLLDDIILYRIGDLKIILEMEGLNILQRHKEKVEDLISSVEKNDIEQIKRIKKEIKILIYNENKMDKNIKSLK